MAFPIALALAALPEFIKLATDLYERLSNDSMTQEEFDAEWAEMVAKVNAAEAKWSAAG